MGLPTQLAGETYPGPRRELTGSIEVAENGCVYFSDGGVQRLAVFPRGSELSSPVRLPDGSELADGEAVRAIGSLVAADAMPGGPDGYWAMVTGYCSGSAAEVAVLDEVVSEGR